MRSVCGRYVISFNGEVYNFKALRAEMEGFGPYISRPFRYRDHVGLYSLNGAFFTRWNASMECLRLLLGPRGEKTTPGA